MKHIFLHFNVYLHTLFVSVNASIAAQNNVIEKNKNYINFEEQLLPDFSP